MNILVANNHLSRTGGTENYTYALIIELLRLGHTVEYFTFEKGEVSERIEKLGVKFRSKRVYDLILANHKPVVEYLYRKGFIIQTCHGIYPELEQPSVYADAYVSISFEVKEYLESKGIKSKIIYNGIDCKRFFPETTISSTLNTVLSLCQSDSANQMVEECCNILKVNFLKADKFKENLWSLEKEINKADLVIGIGRSLYDAMACGRSIISFDSRDYNGKNLGDGYLHKSNIEQSIKYNCSGRGSMKSFTNEILLEEIKKYNNKDGEFFREYALENLNIKKSTYEYLNLIPKPKIIIYKFFKMTYLLLLKFKSKFKI